MPDRPDNLSATRHIPVEGADKLSVADVTKKLFSSSNPYTLFAEQFNDANPHYGQWVDCKNWMMAALFVTFDALNIGSTRELKITIERGYSGISYIHKLRAGSSIIDEKIKVSKLTLSEELSEGRVRECYYVPLLGAEQIRAKVSSANDVRTARILVIFHNNIWSGRG